MPGLSIRLSLVLLGALGSTLAQAEEQSRLLESVRFKARGDTYVAAYDSDEATRANPATLAQGKVNFQLRAGQVDGFIGDNALKTISDLTNLAQDTKSSATSVLQTFTSRFGKRQYLRLQGNLLSMRIKSFEISPFASSKAFVDMRIPTTPNLEFQVDAAAGVNVATGFAVSQTVELGVNFKYLTRTVIEGEAAFSQVLDMVDSSSSTLTDVFQQREGTQLGTDLGLIWHPTKESRYGLLVENVGYGANLNTSSALPLPLLRQRVNLGWLYRADRNPWHWDFLVDAQDLINPPTLDPLRQLHLGLEFGRNFFSRDHDFGLQLGLSEGYLTSGAFLDLWALRLSVAYYAAELGEYAGQRKDRRWGLSMQVLTMTF
jgi:hypothetical protein